MSAAPGGQVDELGSAVGRVGAAGEVAQLDQVVDQLGGGRQAQLRPVGEFGQSYATGPDVAEYLEVRFADIPETGGRAGLGEVIAEQPQEPHEELSDGQTVVGLLS